MSTIGSSTSFWQDDQNYWNNVQQQNQASSASTSLINAMGSLMVNKAKGLASIANQQALTRTNNQLQSALQDAIAQTQGTSSSTSSSGTSSSATATPPKTLAASGTGSVPLTTNTSLTTLGVIATGTITVGDGTNTTTYTATGKDTVGDLINAINAGGPKNAQVTAYLNSSNKLVLTAQNTTDTISVGGLFAGNVGFGTGNQTFSPTAASTSSNAVTSTTPTINSLFGLTSTPSGKQSSVSTPTHSPYSAADYSTATAASFLSGVVASSTSSSINLLA